MCKRLVVKFEVFMVISIFYPESEADFFFPPPQNIFSYLPNDMVLYSRRLQFECHVIVFT